MKKDSLPVLYRVFIKNQLRES